MLQKEGINPLNVQEKPKGARANPTRALSLSGLTKSYIKKVRVAVLCAVPEDSLALSRVWTR